MNCSVISECDEKSDRRRCGVYLPWRNTQHQGNCDSYVQMNTGKDKAMFCFVIFFLPCSSEKLKKNPFTKEILNQRQKEKEQPKEYYLCICNLIIQRLSFCYIFSHTTIAHSNRLSYTLSAIYVHCTVLYCSLNIIPALLIVVIQKMIKFENEFVECREQNSVTNWLTNGSVCCAAHSASRGLLHTIYPHVYGYTKYTKIHSRIFECAYIY